MSSDPCVVVLDTNVVLDWLLFANPAVLTLGQAVLDGHVRWIATPSMRDEFFHVIGRGRLDAWEPRPAEFEAMWSRHCSEVPTPSTVTTAPCCSDRDDQKFVDLALTGSVHWLLSRDRAVLRLSKALARHGVRVDLPHRWQPGDPARVPCR